MAGRNKSDAPPPIDGELVAIGEIASPIKTIQVNEVLTMDIQRDKLSENLIVLLNRAQAQIWANMKDLDALAAAQVMEKVAGVWGTINGARNPLLGGGNVFNFNFGEAKTAISINQRLSEQT